MAGSTGRMTREAIAARGPRMILTACWKGERCIGHVIQLRHSDRRATARFGPMSRSFEHVLAQSYTLSYLLRLGRAAIADQARRGNIIG
jgi:hypothetical protein